jgi:hypothetical protein
VYRLDEAVEEMLARAVPPDEHSVDKIVRVVPAEVNPLSPQNSLSGLLARGCGRAPARLRHELRHEPANMLVVALY